MRVSEARLLDLADTVRREAEHLRLTSARLFAEPFDLARVVQLRQNVEDGERVDAFSMRLCLLQDTLGD